jgi:hypothetical protein
MGVNIFVGGLATDLNHRCERLLIQISNRDVHPDIAHFNQGIISRLQEIRCSIQALLNSEQLNYSPLWCYALSDYQDLAHAVAMIEQFAVPILLRYDDRDHQCFNMIKALTREIGYPNELLPTVTTTSEQYYWTQPDLRIVGVPAGDLDGGILGWPDLLHEIGHLLLAARPAFLAGFTPAVNRYFREQHDRLADLGGHKKDNQWLAIAQIKWGEKQEGTWRVELTADLIATYLVGPSYGWQHIRLTAGQGSDPYYPSPGNNIEDHPADQARLDAVLAMLRLLEMNRKAEKIEAQWSGLLELGLYAQLPPGYELYYPSSLIQKLAEIVLAGCRQNALIPCAIHDRHSNPGVVPLIDQAWQEFNHDPANYPTWEGQAITRLKDSFQPDSTR